MNRKQVILLIVAVVVIGGLGLLVSNKKSQSWEASSQQLGGKVIKNLSVDVVNAVEQIKIRQHSGEVNLAKQGEVWGVQERGGYPANFGNISDLLKKLMDLKVAQPVRVTEKQLTRLELTPPDKGTNSGTIVELKEKGGNTAASILLGKKHMKESPSSSPYGGGSWPDGRYVMVGNDPKTVAVVSEAFSNVEAKPEEWLEKEFFKIENHKSISLTSTNVTNSWAVVKESQTNDWKLADAKANEVLDTGKASGVTSALSYPSFNDVATNTTPEKTGLDKPLVAKIETFDGFKYDVKIGKKVEDKEDYYIQLAVNANLQTERTAGKDEKPEDKEKLDKEFKDKLAKQEEKLKNEKAFEKWVYIVPKYTIDPLLKERKDLLKEEPKPEEKKEEK
ncbi:MAG: DUF4340 domain-containing protein, partial [Verrucomicrobia subdivision 3 bacterium]|nr:DUF4340 domain-containing protein [Limisphaerales bacterium]